VSGPKIATIDGWPAYRIARILKHHWKEETEDLPFVVLDLLEDYRADRVRGAKAARGNVSGQSAEMAADSKSEITTAGAADILHLSERRVRQLAGMGKLPGRQDAAGRWSFERGAVKAYKSNRSR
jgi:hypothetical protein